MLAFLNILYLSPSKLVIGLCSVHTIDAAVIASPVNEYSTIKLILITAMIQSKMCSTQKLQSAVCKTMIRTMLNYKQTTNRTT